MKKLTFIIVLISEVLIINSSLQIVYLLYSHETTDPVAGITVCSLLIVHGQIIFRALN